MAAAFLLLPVNAIGAPLKRVGTETLYDFVGTPPDASGLVTARQVLPASGTGGLAQSRLVYLNKNGVTLMPGDNDARANRSSIVTKQVVFGPWQPDAALWADTVRCIEELFAPYEIAFTQSDPGDVPHVEAVFGGRPALLGLDNNVAGVSPFTSDCSVIESSVVFTFVDIVPQNARRICEIQAQEIAHSFGLDHEMLAEDPMTYLRFDGPRAFQDQVAPCGEDAIRPCGLNGQVCRRGQNSVQLLNERLGARFDETPPTVAFASPPNNSIVPPGFRARIDAADNIVVRSATFYVDGDQVGEAGTVPFDFVMPADLAEGEHVVRVVVTDGKQTSTDEIAVTVQRGAPDPGAAGGADVLGGCSTSGSRSSAWLLCATLGFALQRRRAHR